MYDTTTLSNTYKKFGNTMHVEHWHGQMQENYEILHGASLLNNSDNVGKVKNLTGKPKHWKNALQLIHKKYERLCMSKKFDAAIVVRNGRYPKIFPASALELEKIAREKPQHDWQVEVIGAWETLVYQRQGWKKWLLIEIGKGYA